MQSFLLQAAYSPQGLVALMAHREDRTEHVRAAVEHLGGKLAAMWLTFGEHDIIGILDFPDHIGAAALRVAMAAGGVLAHVHLTPLYSLQDGLAILEKAAGSIYKPISGAKPQP